MNTAILLEPPDLAAAGDCALRAPEHRGWECSGRCVHPEARDCAQERDPYGDGRARDCMCECHGASEWRS